MKVLLAGSPSITLSTFETIINNFEVVALITQPDRPQGRGMIEKATPAASLAAKHGIKIFKPNRVSEIKKELLELDFDILVTFAFGQYIPSFLLEKGKYLPVNIHGSLLPKYRGAAPIHHAILNNDTEIGITLIEMVKEMDAGDMLFKASKKIDNQTTTGEAMKIIADLASENIVNWLKKIANEDYKKIKQGAKYSLAPKITKDFGLIDQNMTFKEVLRKIRALNPMPGAFIIINDKRLKLFDITSQKHPQAVGIKLADGYYYATDFQWAGKKRITL